MTKPAIAEQPIECIKVMRCVNGNLRNLFSFAYTTAYRLGELTHMAIFIEQDMQLFENPTPDTAHLDSIFGNTMYSELKRVFEKGVNCEENKEQFMDDAPDTYKYCTLERGICSFIDKEDAQKTFDWAVRSFDSYCDICLVKCEIPVGAKYWKGVSNCTGYECGYTSDQIIPLEILKTERAK
jgi:hypothetical protein